MSDQSPRHLDVPTTSLGATSDVAPLPQQATQLDSLHTQQKLPANNAGTKNNKRALQELDEKNWLLECEEEARKCSFQITAVHKQAMLRTYRLKKALMQLPIQRLIEKAKDGCQVSFTVLGERLARENVVHTDGKWDKEPEGYDSGLHGSTSHGKQDSSLLESAPSATTTPPQHTPSQPQDTLNNQPTQSPFSQSLDQNIDLDALVQLGQKYGTIFIVEPLPLNEDHLNVNETHVNENDLNLDENQAASPALENGANKLSDPNTSLDIKAVDDQVRSVNDNAPGNGNQKSKRRYRISIGSNSSLSSTTTAMNDPGSDTTMPTQNTLSTTSTTSPTSLNTQNHHPTNHASLGNNPDPTIPAFFASYLTLGLTTQKHSQKGAHGQKAQGQSDKTGKNKGGGDHRSPQTSLNHQTPLDPTPSSHTDSITQFSPAADTNPNEDAASNCHYYYINNSRCVWPYPFTVLCNTKSRHIGLVLKEMINAEFPSFHSGYLEHAVSNQRLLMNGVPIINVGTQFEHVLGLELTKHVLSGSESKQHEVTQTTIPNTSSKSSFDLPALITQAKNGIITVNTEQHMILTGYSLHHYKIKQNDVLQHLIHSHEPPVPADNIEIAFNPHKIDPKRGQGQSGEKHGSTDSTDSIHSIAKRELRLTSDDVDNIIIVNKPSGIPVHATGRYRQNTIIGILMNHFAKQQRHAEMLLQNTSRTNENTHSNAELLQDTSTATDRNTTHSKISLPPIPSLHIVHRLDIATSGLLIIATSLAAAQKMSALMSSRSVQKHYIARVKGYFPMRDDICDPVTNSNAIEQMVRWGREKWEQDGDHQAQGESHQSQDNLGSQTQNKGQFLSPCDGFNWKCNQSDASINENLSANGIGLAWNGVGVRTIQALVSSRSGDQSGGQPMVSSRTGGQSMLSSRTGDQSLAQTTKTESPLQDSTNWSQSTLHHGLEIIVDRPIQKHHQNHSSHVEGGIGVEDKLNANGNHGVMETPYLLYDDFLTFNDINKFTDTVVNNNINKNKGLKGDKNKKTTDCDSNRTLTRSQPETPAPDSKISALRPVLPNPTKKSSLTIFRGLVYDPITNTTLVHCLPKTGRTHQIRIHLAHLGFPIDNDDLYVPSDAKFMSPGTVGVASRVEGQQVGAFVLDGQHYAQSSYTSPQSSDPFPTSLQSLTPSTASSEKSTNPIAPPKHSFYDRIESVARYESRAVLETLWKQSYHPGCCFCEDVNAGLWPEKKLYVHSTGPLLCDKSRVESSGGQRIDHRDQTSRQMSQNPTQIDDNLIAPKLFSPTDFITNIPPEEFTDRGDEIRLASFTYKIEVPATKTNTDSTSAHTTSPNPSKLRDITLVPNTNGFVVDSNGLVTGPFPSDSTEHSIGPIIPLNINPLSPPRDIVESIHWDDETLVPTVKNSSGAKSCVAADTESPSSTSSVSPHVLPPIPTIDVRREYIYLHATRYETKEWTFYVETPDWARGNTSTTSASFGAELYIPCSYYNGPDTASNYCPVGQ